MGINFEAATMNLADRLAGTDTVSQKMSRFGHYDLKQKLGSGEMGNVYLARQRGIERDVVIKVLPKRLQQDPNYLGRFRKEAQVAAQLQHVNIVKAIDVGASESGHFYFVMEHVEGESLKQMLERGTVFDERKAIAIALQIVRALVHGHTRSIHHGEIRPDNVRLTPGGIVKLAGLGLAKEVVDHALSRTRMILNAAHYVSPEEILGRPKDSRSDIYSLGATLYHMVTGQAPFDGTSPVEVLANRLSVQLESPKFFNPGLSDDFCHLLERMLARDPADRYQVPQDLLYDLEMLHEGSPLGLVPIAPQRTSLKRLEEGGITEIEKAAAKLSGRIAASSASSRLSSRRSTAASSPFHGIPHFPFVLGLLGGLALVLSALSAYLYLG